jgi:RNA polymerase sigma factor (sigma-70 family)
MCPVEVQTVAPTEQRALALPVPTSLLSDERLARMVGEGNDRAFATLYSRFHQPLYRYCNSMVRHEADAQDALQSTFTAALGALRRGQRDAPLRPWLFRIAHNESISLLRRRRVTDELPETAETPGPSVETRAEERAQLASLVADLQELPERQRGALVMRELSGLSHEDLAQALGITVGAAKQAVFEARQALQEFSEGRAMACEDIQRVVSDGDRRALRGRRLRAHLRDCAHCRAFASAIPERRRALLALSPALPAAAASGLFGRIVGGAAGAHHGGGGGLLVGAGGKSLGVALSAKTVAAGIAIVVTAAVGAVGTVEVVSHSSHPSTPAHLVRGAGGPAGRASGASAAGGASDTSSAGRSGTAHGRAHSLSRHATDAKSRRSAFSRGQHGATTRSSARSSTGLTGVSRGSGNSGGNSRASGANPNAGGTNSNAHRANPNAKGGNSGGSANAGGTNSNAHGANPNAKGGNVNAAGGLGNANSHGSNPKARGGNGSASVTSTVPQVTGSSNSHGSNPHATGGK